MDQQPPKIRDSRLDFFRGLFLVVMTIDHLPSILRDYLKEGLGFVSAAEGFVFVSGLTCGWIYGDLANRDGMRAAWRKIARRISRLYLCHLLLLTFVALLFLVRGDSANLKAWAPLFADKPGTALVLGSLFFYLPTLLDILPMYCVFLAALPIIIRQLQKGNHWHVFSGSAIVWMVPNLGIWPPPSGPEVAPGGIYLGSFNLLGWQFLFTCGVLVGYLRTVLAAEFNRLPRGLTFSLAGIVAIMFFALKHSGFSFESFAIAMTNNRSLGLLRVINFLALFVLSSAVCVNHRVGFRIVTLLGRNSLEVFTVHVVLSYLISNLPFMQFASHPQQVFGVVVCVASMWILASMIEALRVRHSFRWPRLKI